MLEATEVLKLLLHVGEPLTGRLLHFDALSMRFRETRLPPDPDCPLCARGRPFPGYIDYAAFCGSACPPQPVQARTLWQSCGSGFSRELFRDRDAQTSRLKPLPQGRHGVNDRSAEHTSELQSLMRSSYAVFCSTKQQ